MDKELDKLTVRNKFNYIVIIVSRYVFFLFRLNKRKSIDSLIGEFQTLTSLVIGLEFFRA